MCTECVSDEKEFRAYMQDRYFQQYSKEDLVTSTLDKEGVLSAIGYAVENYAADPNTDPQVLARVLDIRERINNAAEDEVQGLLDQAQRLLGEMVTDRYKGMEFTHDLLAVASRDTITDDQAAFPTENVKDRLLRGVQHTYYYHETRPQYFYEVVDQEFIDAVGNRMRGYAQQAMETLPQFNTALLVLQEEGAIEAISTIAMSVYLEALMAGYYAGSQGTECMMWQTHELGPIGRMDEREEDVKIAEVLAKFEEHKENNTHE